MYNGTISLGDAADLNILKQQVELIAALNSQLKEFSGLNGMIDENTGALAGNAEQWNAVMNTWIRMQKACRNGGFPFRQALV